MDAPFAGVCMASVAVTTVVLAAGAPEGPHGTCVVLAICVVFYGGMALLIVGLGVLRPAAATNDPAGAVNYNSGVFAQQSGLGAGLNENLLGVPRRADKEGLGAVYYRSDSHADKFTGGPVAAVGRNKAAAGGALAGRAHRVLPFMGTLAASSAVTGLAAGTASPAAGFALFVLLLGGLSLVTLRVLGA